MGPAPTSVKELPPTLEVESKAGVSDGGSGGSRASGGVKEGLGGGEERGDSGKDSLFAEADELSSPPVPSAESGTFLVSLFGGTATGGESSGDTSGNGTELSESGEGCARGE